jgi:5'-nucleotidase
MQPTPRRLLVAFAAALALAPGPAPRVTVTLVALSDYHSHARPFFSEGRRDQAGIARAIAYLKAAKAGPATLVVSGGDTLNAGTPAWSDEFRCVEWPWLNGLVDVMALGNHDLDYGWPQLERCMADARYPVLSANLVDARGEPLLRHEGKPYFVAELAGVRLGFFSLGGPDVQRLVRKEQLPEGAAWREAIPAARRVVEELRGGERVSAVVFIGHQLREDDEAMAAAVPGIDLVFGSHSHHKSGLRTIPGTRTLFISPFQYLAYLSRVELSFESGRLVDVRGALVRLDERASEDPEIKERVARLQDELRTRRPERFAVVGRTDHEIADAGITTGESPIGNWATEVLRRAAGAHAFFATASSFRAALPPGEVTLEEFYSAFPYRNRIVTTEMSGALLAQLVALSAGKAGSDGFSQVSGVRAVVRPGRVELRVLRDPARPDAGYVDVRPGGRYRIATTDFQALVAAGYKELFARSRVLGHAARDSHELLLAALKAGALRPALDGRLRLEK